MLAALEEIPGILYNIVCQAISWTLFACALLTQIMSSTEDAGKKE